MTTPKLDFSNITNLKVEKDAVADYKSYELGNDDGPAVFQMAPAMEANPAYWNAFLAESTDIQHMAKKGKANSKLLVAARKIDRTLYPLHIIKGWSNFKDANGVEVPFTLENCQHLFGDSVVPNEVFDKFRETAADDTNYNIGTINASAIGKK